MSDKNKPLATEINGGAAPILSFVRNEPEMAAAISKLVTTNSDKKKFDKKGKKTSEIPNNYDIKTTSQKINESVRDADSILQLLPDLEIATQILVTSVLSPKGMTDTELIFKCPDDILSHDKSAALTKEIDEYFNTVYKIKNDLYRIFKQVLVGSGSHIRAVLPESSIDEFINRDSGIGIENLKEFADAQGRVASFGILGPSTVSDEKVENKNDSKDNAFKIAYESISNSLNSSTSVIEQRMFQSSISVIDNFNVLKFPRVLDKIANQKISVVTNRARTNYLKTSFLESSISLESSGGDPEVIKSIGNFRGMSDKELTDLLYRRSSAKYTQTDSIKAPKNLDRKSIGKPLILELPSEAVIPVIIPGQENKHLAYFIILDASGNPLSLTTDRDYQEEFKKNSNASANTSSLYTQINNRVSNSYGDEQNSLSALQRSEYSLKVFADMVEQDLMSRLKNGAYKTDVSIKGNDDIYKLMLTRALQSKATQLLFIPAEMVSYFAYQYYKSGVGKSLMDNIKVTNSQRLALMFANIMAAVRNSISRTNVKLKLDEDDPDPKHTIEIAMDELVRSRQGMFPMDRYSPTDVVNWLQRSGYNFVYEGHPGLPDITMDFEASQSAYQKVDTDLEETLRKRSYMAFSLNPETVDQGFTGELATSVVANNILLSKRVNQIQEVLMPQVSDHIRKVILADGNLISKLKSIVIKDFDKESIPEELKKIPEELLADRLLQLYINGVEVKLPKPDNVKLKNQSEAFETFDQLLDKLINNAFISQDILGDANIVGSEVSQAANTLKAIAKAYFTRKWMLSEGVMPELMELASSGGESGVTGIWDDQEKAIKGITETFSQLVTKIAAAKKAAGEAVANSGGDAGGGFGSSSSTSSSFDSGFGSSDSDGFGGADDGFDLGGSVSDTDSNTDTNGENVEGSEPGATDENGDETNKSEDELDTGNNLNPEV